jgi:hypothetical protein
MINNFLHRLQLSTGAPFHLSPGMVRFHNDPRDVGEWKQDLLAENSEEECMFYYNWT